MECKRLGCIPCNRTKPGGTGECPSAASAGYQDFCNDRERQQMCMWKYDRDTSSFDTECGEKFIFCDDGGPGHDGFIYCPYCSGRLINHRELRY